MARRRIACRMARRRIACLWPVARSCAVWPVARSRIVSSLPMSATCMSLRYSRFGEPNARRLPCPGPTWPVADAANRCFANIVSFVMPWRSNSTRSAARLRLRVGPLASRKAVAGQTGSSDIVGNNRPSFGHFRAFPGISGYVRIYPDTRWSSRAVSSVAGHAVLYGLSLRYRSSPGTAWGKGHRVPYHLSPDTA